MKTVLAALSAFLLITTIAAADSPPPAAVSPTTDWVANEVVVSEAQAPGPAFWHVKKGDSEIWILGTVSPLANGTNFNQTHINEIIQGARAVFLPPTASAGLLSAGWFLLTHRGLLSMPDGKKLEDTLTPDIKARFVAARTALKLGPEKFSDDPPLLAGFKLRGKFDEAHKLAPEEGIMAAVKAIAKDRKVPMQRIGDYDALDMVKEMLRLPLDRQQTCLADAVSYTEGAAQHAKDLSEAWAVGDLKGIKAHFVRQAFGDCLKQASSFGKFQDRAVGDYLKVIHEALSKPGKVVMLANIGALLSSTGVADALHKEGVTIEGPAE